MIKPKPRPLSKILNGAIKSEPLAYHILQIFMRTTVVWTKLRDEGPVHNALLNPAQSCGKLHSSAFFRENKTVCISRESSAHIKSQALFSLKMLTTIATNHNNKMPPAAAVIRI